MTFSYIFYPLLVLYMLCNCGALKLTTLNCTMMHFTSKYSFVLGWKVGLCYDYKLEQRQETADFCLALSSEHVQSTTEKVQRKYIQEDSTMKKVRLKAKESLHCGSTDEAERRTKACPINVSDGSVAGAVSQIKMYNTGELILIQVLLHWCWILSVLIKTYCWSKAQPTSCKTSSSSVELCHSNNIIL